jgi:FkbM family methyltransferase
MIPPLPSWNWRAFRGTQTALRFNRRDLETLDRVVTGYVPGRTACIQAGGNLGIFPKRLSQWFQTVYTFEPDPECFTALCHNAPEPNIIKIQAALGDEASMVALSRTRPPHKPTGPQHEGLGWVCGPGVLPMVRLDDALSALMVCDLLYLDLEGYELPALRGARGLVRRCRPVIVLEVTANQERCGFSQTELVDDVLAQGYRCEWQDKTDRVFVPEAA